MKLISITSFSWVFYVLLQEAYGAIIKEREAAEKLKRAREAREKQDRERAQRAANKKALVDFNGPGDQEGVMDSLLDALRTGSAFNRDAKRKRAPRAAGGMIFIQIEKMIRIALENSILN